MTNNQTCMELVTEMIDREGDVAYIMDCVNKVECCSVVGVSNMGKSTLLRSLSRPALRQKYFGVKADEYVFVYIDFNLILQMSEQGFYEVILRHLLTALEAKQADEEPVSAVRKAYQTIISPNNQFLIPLAFEESLEAVNKLQQGMWVLLFDELDEIFAEIEPRVFVRLRAMKDRYWNRLCYVTATDHPLPEIRRDRQAGEFCELFAAHTRHLAPLDEVSAQALVNRWAAQCNAELTSEDVQFVLECGGGHPSLVLTTCRVLARAQEEALWRPLTDGYERIRERLDGDANVRLECAKLWSDLNAAEHEALLALVKGQETTAGLDSLVEKGIVRVTASGGQVFGSLFAGFVRRQQLVRRREPRGVRIDVEAGDVWVDGNLAPTLTELEYKLLLLLYGNLDKICDKYKIVESVWGENYIDEVDDARIEKLMSRLREKIEPVPEKPKYLFTVRGRGYKLVSPE